MRIGQKLSIPLGVLVLSNLITCITLRLPLLDYFTTVVLFIIIIVILQLIKKEIHHNIVSISLLAISIIFQKLGHVTDITGISLFLCAVTLSIKSKKILVTYLSLFIYVTLYRFNIENMVPSQITTYLSGGSLIAVIFQHYIFPKTIIKEDIKPDYLISPVKKDIVDTIRLIILGYQYNEINDKLELSITDDQVRRNVNKEVKRLGFRNREHMIFFLTEKGIIKSISYDLDIKE